MTNEKVYIGQTSYTIEKRRSEHEYWASTLDKHTVFYSAIRKYGIDNFTWEIIDYANNKEELNGKEIYWIDFYRSYVGFEDSHGYNMTKGGDGRVGYKHNEETKIKIGQSNKGKNAYENNHNAKKVFQFSLDGKLIAEHLTAKHGAELVDAKLQNITDCCRGEKSKTVCGFIWIYKEDYTDDLLQKRIDELPKNSTKARKVIQLDMNDNFINEYDSAYNASKITGCDRSTILKCCKGKVKYHKGFKWKFV